MFAVHYRTFNTKTVKFFPNMQSCQDWINEMTNSMLIGDEFEVITIFEI